MSWIKPQELRWFLPAAIAIARAALLRQRLEGKLRSSVSQAECLWLCSGRLQEPDLSLPPG